VRKKGWVERELHRVVDNYLEPQDQRFFNSLVAEALLILLERTKPECVVKLKQGEDK